MWKIILLMVLLCREKFKGPLLYPAPHGAWPCTRAQLCGECKNPVPAHGAFGARNVFGPKKRLSWQQWASPCQRIWAPETFQEHVCFTSQRNGRGDVQLSEHCPFLQCDPDCSLKASRFGISSQLFPLSPAEPLALCLYFT